METEETKMQQAIQTALAEYINQQEAFLINGKSANVVMDKQTHSKFDKARGITIVEPIDKQKDYQWSIIAKVALWIQNNKDYIFTKDVQINAICKLSMSKDKWTAQIISCTFYKQ